MDPCPAEVIIYNNSKILSRDMALNRTKLRECNRP